MPFNFHKKEHILTVSGFVYRLKPPDFPLSLMYLTIIMGNCFPKTQCGRMALHIDVCDVF